MWYYVREKEKVQIRFDELARMIANGELSDSTLVWTKGMSNWCKAGDCSDLMPTVESMRGKTGNPRGTMPEVGFGDSNTVVVKGGDVLMNPEIIGDVSTFKLLNATKSFIVLRVLASLVIFGICIVLCAIFIGLGVLLKSPVALLIMCVLLLGGGLGLAQLVNRLVLFTVKAGHVAAITEILRTGEVTDFGGGKGALRYAKDVVASRLGSTTIAFGMEQLLKGAAKQIAKWTSKAGNIFGNIPVLNTIIGVINAIISTLMEYVSVSVLSFVFLNRQETNTFKSACDGLVYYAQGWKDMLKGSVKTVVFLYCTWFFSFIVFFGVGTAIFGSSDAALGGVTPILVGLLFMILVNGVIVEPVATCMMIRSYYVSIAKVPELNADLYGKLLKVSSKFKKLDAQVGRANA